MITSSPLFASFRLTHPHHTQTRKTRTTHPPTAAAATPAVQQLTRRCSILFLRASSASYSLNSALSCMKTSLYLLNRKRTNRRHHASNITSFVADPLCPTGEWLHLLQRPAVSSDLSARTYSVCAIACLMRNTYMYVIPGQHGDGVVVSSPHLRDGDPRGLRVLFLGCFRFVIAVATTKAIDIATGVTLVIASFVAAVRLSPKQLKNAAQHE